MKRQTIKIEDCEISFCSLEDGQGNILQFWYTVVPAYPEPIAQQMCRIERAEGELLRLNRIDQSSVAAKRLFSTDIITQHQDLLSYKTRHSTDFFFSATQQPPASGSKVALLGMCLLNITAKFRDGRFFYFDTSSDIRHMFAEQIVDDSACEHSDSEQQTQKVFDILQDGLCRLGAT